MPTVDELTEPTVMRNMRKLAQGVDNNFNDMQTSVDNAVETANNAMEATEGFDDRITDNSTAIQNEVTARQNADEAEADARAKADITGIATAISSGAINVTLNRELGNLSDSVVGPFIKTATLIPSATDRAFKLQFQYWDDTTYTTNDFVIPEGGGTDVSVSGVTVSEGDNDNEFKVSIQLDDATTIDSNSYPFPESVINPYPTTISGILSGTTLNLTIGLSNSTNVTGTANLSAFLTKTDASSTYATKTEVTAVDNKVTTVDNKVTAIGVTSEGNNVTVNGSNATIVKSVSGTVTDGNLKITVNGVESGDIPLPESGNDMQPGYIITTSYPRAGAHSSSRGRVFTWATDGVNNVFDVFPTINAPPVKSGVLGKYSNITFAQGFNEYGYAVPENVVKEIILTNYPSIINSDGNYYIKCTLTKVLSENWQTLQLLDYAESSPNISISNKEITVLNANNFMYYRQSNMESNLIAFISVCQKIE